MAICEVAILSGHYPIYDYLHQEDLSIGQLVVVPVRQRYHLAVVAACKQDTFIAQSKLKSIETVLDSLSLAPMWAIIQWCSNYYHCPLGQVAVLALPGLSEWKKYLKLDPLSQVFKLAKVAKPRLTPVQNKLYKRIQLNPLGVSLSFLLVEGFRQQTVDKLVQHGVIEKANLTVSDIRSDASIVLNDQQRQAVDAVKSSDGFAAHVLFGVTGSGKTEVYFSLIEWALSCQKQALLLVPEIGLTPQMLKRIQSRFSGVRLLVTHSKLSATERLRVLKTIHLDQVDVVIGTRSAIFSPLARLGVIIIDEEHDSSYRQQSGLRYSARDLAVVRAKYANVPLLLGSATPALETLYNVKQGKYRCHYLTQRHGRFQQTRLHVLDIRGHRLDHGIDPRIVKKMADHLKENRTVLVFVNRRGYAPVLLCRACGWSCRCDACDSYLVWHHRLNGLKCHHCGKTMALPSACGGCSSKDDLVPVGYGTERMEAQLSKLFPEQVIVRVDRDSQVDMDDLSKKLASGAVNIVIGTQMLAKGHHFPSLSLAIIVDVDAAIYSSDFRSIETAMQTLMQVAGRVGRGDEQGEVVVQTHQPNHSLFIGLTEQNYDQYAQSLLSMRMQSGMPPYSFLALLRAESRSMQAGLEFLQLIKARASQQLGVDVWGPVGATMTKKNNIYRQQLLFRSNSRQDLNGLGHCVQRWVREKSSNNVAWYLEVDPYEVC